MGDKKWVAGPTLNREQMLAFRLARAEIKAAKADLERATAELRAWVASSTEAAPLLSAVRDAEAALVSAGKDAEQTRKALEEALGIDLDRAQVNLDTGETRIPDDRQE